ncbi:tetratricopeptide repeat protein [Stutzerimonas urumqiensis]|uniref:tetratricopeptide repeat protein n=1 Tax=Stutzerimonas urumqiensis TaxID=638269 RepID=UPI003BA9BC11
MNMTEDEQLAQIKDWWQRNGKPLLMGVVLALVLVLGWQAWRNHQQQQAHEASMLYQELLTKVLSGTDLDLAEIARLGNTLKEQHGGTHYAQFGALFLAKVAVESGDLDEAASTLDALVKEPAGPTIEELARQRLAAVLAAQGKTEEGLKLLDGQAPTAYQASREELKGDLLVQLGRLDDAHAAYVKAKAALSEEAAVGGLQLKLDDLARGEA